MTNPIKLVLLDLDGTLWDGTLLEDGLEGVRLNRALAQRVAELDALGILLAAVSKNHPDDVEAALGRFDLSARFFATEASFEPKSAAVSKVLRLVRFAPESCVFVDDTAFEREEVAHAIPGIRAVSPEDFLASLASSKTWAVSSSPEEALVRKRFYLSEQKRQQVQAESTGTFREFLQESGLAVKIGPAPYTSAGRISELTQRTNQLNFSANRYQLDDVQRLLESPEHACFLATARDRYGDYGVIGFASLHYLDGKATIQDLMLSCRIQGRGVETALVAALALKAKAGGARQLIGLYRPTRRNGQIAGTFERASFSLSGEEGEYRVYVLQLDGALPLAPRHVRLIVCESPITEKDVGIPFVRDLVKRCVEESVVIGRILDVGAGWDGVLGEDCDLFLEVGENKHVRLDMERYPHTDIVADAQDMRDIGDGSFDSALCLEVLEHCTDPFALSRELIRVLRPGGTAVVSAPMDFPIHDTPGDYWRFTPDGLKLLFKGRATVVAEHVEGRNDHPVRTVLILRK
jgi:FkbH-like protein